MYGANGKNNVSNLEQGWDVRYVCSLATTIIFPLTKAFNQTKDGLLLQGFWDWLNPNLPQLTISR